MLVKISHRLTDSEKADLHDRMASFVSGKLAPLDALNEQVNILSLKKVSVVSHEPCQRSLTQLLPVALQSRQGHRTAGRSPHYVDCSQQDCRAAIVHNTRIRERAVLSHAMHETPDRHQTAVRVCATSQPHILVQRLRLAHLLFRRYSLLDLFRRWKHHRGRQMRHRWQQRSSSSTSILHQDGTRIDAIQPSTTSQ